MKRRVKEKRGIIRGRSSAVVLSILIHVALLLGAGVFIVVKIIEKPDHIFDPPPRVERPKMNLKKLRVKVKEASKPRKTTQRITSTRRTVAMPDIRLPPMSSMGAGLDEGIGGFQMVADLTQMSLLGSGRSVGNDFEGTFYHMKRDRRGRPIKGWSVEDVLAGGISSKFDFLIREFFEKGWDTKVFDRFYRAPKKLYATQFFMPSMRSVIAPEKFGIEENIEAALWAIHYKGNISHNEGGRFRFWGNADDILFVRVNGAMVLDGSYEDRVERVIHDWRSRAKQHMKYPLSTSHARIGDWFTLEAGEVVEMEVLVSEVPGGDFFLHLLVEEEGVDYPKNRHGAPLLPIFKTMETSVHLLDEMKYLTYENEVDLTGGSLFSAH